MKAKIDVPRDQLRDFCQKNRIRKLSFFGSALREDFRPESDIDVLVEFQPGARVGFFALYDIEQELSEVLGGRKVDLHTPQGLSDYLREQVLKEAEEQFVSA